MTPRDPYSFLLARVVFRALLRVAPRRFREIYGDEMARLFVERIARAKSRRGASRLVLGGWTDAVLQGLSQRFEARAPTRQGPGTSRPIASALERFRLDARSGWRAWRRAPVATVTLIALLTLGMSGVTALFGPLYALVLAPLPLPHAEQLVRIGGGIPLYNAYFDSFEQRDRLAAIFSNVTAFGHADTTQVTIAGRRLNVEVEGVTPEFFETMGVAPQMGQSLIADSVTSTSVVLSDRAWQTLFNRAPDVIGKSVQIGAPRTVVGVMPAGFDFPEQTDVWMPIRTAPGRVDPSLAQFVGRLRGGISVDQGAAGLQAIGYRRGQGPTGLIGKDGPVLETLRAFLHGDQRPLLWNLWAVALLFLLLACAGSVNLLLAHGVRRRSELAVRMALGAERPQLVRQLLTETLLLVAVSAAAGVWMSLEVGRWLRAQWPALAGTSFVPSTLGLAAALAGVVTILCGLAPALHATGADIASALKFGSLQFAARRSMTRRVSAREVLAGVQLTLALALVIAAGLLARSLSAHLSVPLGFDARNVVVVAADLPPAQALTDANQHFLQQHHLDQFGDHGWSQTLLKELSDAVGPAQRSVDERNRRFFSDGLAGLAALPEVVSAGVISPVPFTRAVARINRSPVFNGPPPPSGRMDDVPVAFALHGSIDTEAPKVLGLHLVAGRPFNAADVSAGAQAAASSRTGSDTSSSPRPAVVAIVNEALAQHFWPGQSAVGHYLYERGYDATVIGVVASFQQNGEVSAKIPAIYLPFTAAGRASMVIKLRDGASVKSLRADANRVLTALMPDLPPVEPESMSDLSTRAFADLRLALDLLGGFALVGAVVAGLGVYAVAMLMAGERTQEMAIRAALGADASDIRLLALWRSVRVMLLSVPAGLGAGWLLARGLSHLLYRVGAADGLTYLVSGAILALVALVAGLLPAWRLGSADPIHALRQE